MEMTTQRKIRTDQISAVAYVCSNYYVRRASDGSFLINYANCYVGRAPTLRLAKKRFRRYGKNRDVEWGIVE